MSNSINVAQSFDPFKDVLAVGKRLRLKDGQLTVEDSTVRSSASAWSRFWTRGQYSQTAILKKMTKLYKGAQKQIGEDEKRDNFVKNLAILEYRATAQNELFKDTNSIVRFFEAKSFIDVASFHEKFEKVDKAVVQAADQKIQDEAKAAQKKLDEQIAAQQKLDQENSRKAQAEAAKQAQEEQRIAEREAIVRPIRENIAQLTKELEELENCSLEDYTSKRILKAINEEGMTREEAEEAIEGVEELEYNTDVTRLKMTLEAANTTLNGNL